MNYLFSKLGIFFLKYTNHYYGVGFINLEINYEWFSHPCHLRQMARC